MTPTARDWPLVSCIMPTYNRRHFVPRAIRSFLRQDFPHKELVIVDDGAEAVGDLVPVDPRCDTSAWSGVPQWGPSATSPASRPPAP